VLGFDLLKSGIYSVLPWVTMALAANIGGWIADTLVSRGVSVTTVRKVMQTVRHACRTGAVAVCQQCRQGRAHVGTVPAGRRRAGCVPAQPWRALLGVPKQHPCANSWA